jgi:hypothetical protein
MGKLMSQPKTAEDSVKLKINQFITAINTSNGISIRNCFADTTSIYQTIFKSRDGQVEIRNEDIRVFAHVISGFALGSANEKISLDVVKVSGPLATVWTPYKFYFDGKLHHCGVNSFQLVRLRDGWKIQYLIDTRNIDGCEK